MQAKSVSTMVSDPYRAGIALGEALASIQPELVLLFSTVHYGGSTDLIDGVRDALESAAVLIVGNSGDGIYETRRASDQGAVALGINSGGAVHWYAAAAQGVGADPERCTRQALAQLEQQLAGRTPRFILLFSDFRADATRIEAVIEREISVPVVGGLAADDNRMQTCYLYHGSEVLQDGIVMLAAEGALRFDISVGNALTAIGQAGLVNSAAGTHVEQIDGVPAMEFIERETGKPVLQTDRGILTLEVVNPAQPAERRLRSIVPDFSAGQGQLGLYGGIEAGKQVRVCLASPSELMAEVYRLAARREVLGFEPAAALVVSCAGRKAILGSAIEVEVSAIAKAFPQGLPLAGFPSFGEMAPLRNGDGYTPNLFHNMSYVLLLLGPEAGPLAG